MDISISLLSALLVHLTLLVLAINIKKYFELVRKIVYLHLPSIVLCLLTSSAYLYKKELDLLLSKIEDMPQCLNIPKYLLFFTFMYTISSIIRSWISVFQFFTNIPEIEESEQE